MKAFYEMTENERLVFSKQQDQEIKQEELNLLNLLKEKYPKMSDKNKNLTLEIIKLLI